MKKIKRTLLAFSLVALFLLSACATNGGAPGAAEETTAPAVAPAAIEPALPIQDGVIPSLEGFTIGVAAIGTSHGFDRLAFVGMIERIEELGGTVIAVDGERDDQRHISNIENLIIQRPDAIINMLGDGAILEPILRRVAESGIPLFTVDHNSAYAVSNVSSDNFGIGTGLAQRIFADMGGDGQVAVFNGFYGVRVAQIRYHMLHAVAQDYPRIGFVEPELIDVIPGTIESARRDVQDLLMRYPRGSGLRAIWAAWDIPSIGAAQAVDEAGRGDEVMVYGIDGDLTALRMVIDPNSSFMANMAQNPRAIGSAAVDQAALHLNGFRVPPSVYVPPTLVTAENYVTALAELGLTLEDLN